MPKLKYKYILNVLQLYFYTDIIMYFGNNKPIKLSVYESWKTKAEQRNLYNRAIFYHNSNGLSQNDRMNPAS